MARNPTGLQYLSERIFPPMLQGIAGRWLLTKLFNVLKEKKLLPNNIKTWLYKPVKEIEGSFRQENTRDDRLILVSALDTLASESDDEDTVVFARKILAILNPEITLPDEEDIDEIIIQGSLSDHIDISTVRVASVYDLDEDREVFIRIAQELDQSKVPHPAVGKYPKAISNKGKKIWDEMIGDFSDEIKRLGHGDVFREWATAIVIYQKLSKEERIRPFMAGTPRLSPHSGDTSKRRRRLIRRMNTAYKYGMQKSSKFNRHLEEVHGVKPGSKRLLTSNPLMRSDGEYSIRFYYRYDMKGHGSHKRKKIRDHMVKTQGFKPGRRKSTLRFALRKYRYRLTLEKENKNEWRMYLTFPLSETEAIFLTGERDKAGILIGLGKIARKWKSEGRFPTSS